MKDIVERLQMVADIKDASSIPPEFLDNTVFLQIMKDAIMVINNLRCHVQTLRTHQQMAAYKPTTQTQTTTSNQQWGQHFNQYQGFGVSTPATLGGWTQIPVSQTMIYTEVDKKMLADAAVQKAVDEAAKNNEP